MNKNSKVYIIVIAFIIAFAGLSLIFLNGEFSEIRAMLEEQQNGQISIQQQEGWELTKHDGIQEQYFITDYTLAGNNLKACLYPIEEMQGNNLIAQDMKVYIKKGDSKLTEKSDKEIEIEAGKIKKICYEVSSDNVDYLRFGNSSTVYEYQNLSLVAYEFEDVQINTTVYEGNSSRGNYQINFPYILFLNTSKVKFGFERLEATTNLEFMNEFKSTSPITQNIYGNYVIKTGNKITGGLTHLGYLEEEVIEIKLDDICTVLTLEDNSTFNPNCEYNTYTETEGNATYYYLEVLFTGFYNETTGKLESDPQYIISSMTESESIQTNITVEGNFSHLEISDIAPYDNLIAYYPFDGDIENTLTTTSYDWTKNNNDGTLVNDAVINETGCLYGDCLRLDGTGDNVNTGSDMIGTGDDSVCAWIYPISWGENNYGRVVDNGKFWLAVDGNALYNRMLFSSNNVASSYSADVIVLNIWQHVCVSRNSTGSANIYINGVISGTANQSSGTPVGGTTNIILGNNLGASRTFDGSIDEVMIFDTVLNPSQISDIYNNQSERFKTNGTQEFKQFNMSLDNEYIKITKTNEGLFGSNIQHKLGEWQTSDGYNETDFGANGNLVSYYHFDESPVDAMGWNDGVINGNVANATGIWSGSYDFDGTDGYVSIANSANAETTSNTISLWMKSLQNGEMRTFRAGVDDYDRFRIGFDEPGVYLNQIGFYDDINNVNSGVALGSYNYNQWYHVLVVCNSSGKFGYVDGVFKANNSQGACFDQLPSYTILIGAGTWSGTSNHFLNGSIDEVMIFNRSLSTTEIKELYIKGRANYQFNTAYNDANLQVVNISSTNFLYEQKQNVGTNNFYSPISSINQANNITFTDTGELDVCGYLNVENGIYTLIDDISATTTCFTILADNITLDFAGFSITGNDLLIDGINSGSNNLIIKNGNIFDFYDGIYLSGDKNNIIDMTIGSCLDDGIKLEGDNNNLTNIISYTNSDNGISISGSNNVISGISGSNTNYGVFTSSGTNNNLAVNTVGNGLGYYFGATDDIIEDSTIQDGMYISGGSDHLIKNSDIDGTISMTFNTDTNFTDTLINNINVDTFSTNIILLNCSIDGSETVDSTSSLIRKWYYRAYVNDSNSGLAIEGTNITAYNRTGDYVFNLSTDATGYTPIYNIIDYVNNGTKTYYSNYSIYAVNDSYPTISHLFNVTLEENNLNDLFSLDNLAPNVTLISPVDGTQDTDGVIRFRFKPEETNELSNCSLIYQSGVYLTTSTIINNQTNIIEIVSINNQHVLWSNDLQWSVNCTDEFNNQGASATYHLDTIPQVGEIGDGGGTQGVISTTKLNPKSVNLIYTDKWEIGEIIKVKIQVLNQSDEKYIPKNISIKKGIDGIIFLGITNNTKNELEAMFEVTSSAELGQREINLIIQDQRTLEHKIIFSVEEEKKIIIKEGIEKYIYWVIGGFFALILMLMILVAFVKDKKR